MPRIEPNPWGDKDAPFETLTFVRPAWFAPGAVVVTAEPVKRDRLEQDVAKTRTPVEVATRDWVPDGRDEEDKALGLFVEAARVGGRTVVRRVRTLDDGDEPLDFGDIGYHARAVDRLGHEIPIGQGARARAVAATAADAESAALSRARAARAALTAFDSNSVPKFGE
jgi:hypothetical protein